MSALVSILVVTMNRPEELSDTLDSIACQTYPNSETIVLENGSTPDVTACNSKTARKYGVTYIVSEINLGVSGGRNVALSHAKGDYILEIDDDAVFSDEDNIENAVQFLRANQEVGILAFKITNYHTGRISRHEYPFRNKRRDPDMAGPCTWFIGAGHVFRRSLIDKIGIYRDFSPWGEEEQDLSIRTLEAGFDIYYYPDVNILHKKSPKGRINNAKLFGSIHLKNRVKVALLNLPLRSVLTYYLVRGLHYVILYRNVTIPFHALVLLYKERQYIRDNRHPIQRHTFRKLARLNGQHYY